MRWCVVAIGLCGCDALLGLDHISTSTPDAPPDAPALPINVTGMASRRYLHLDSASAPVLEGVLITASPISVRDRDGNDLAASWDAGTFSFEIPSGARYAVTYTTPSATIEYQLAAPVLALDDIELGHPLAVTPGPSAAIEWDTTEVLNLQELRFVTTGVWSSTTPAAIAGQTMKFIVAAPNAGFQPGQAPALLTASARDQFMVAHTFTASGSPMNRYWDRYSLLSTTQAANTTTTLSSTMVNVPRSYCEDVAWNHTRDYARFAQLYPTFGSPAADTRLWAVPHAPELGARTPHELALVFGNAGDNHFQFTYGNPLDYDVIALDNIYVTRNAPGGVIGNYAQYLSLVTPVKTPGCGSTAAVAMPAPFAMAPTMNGVPVADNVVIGSDGTTPIKLEWTVDTPSPNMVTQVNLVTVAGNLVTRVYFTVDNTVLVNPRDVTNGTQYRWQIVPSVGSYPNAAQGDFKTRGFPASASIYQTGPFSLAKP